ncbi:hypothetical protein [Natronobeatus ordinarius]|uniref:hypothetical protein n=1 Tax=Natronobeatus ordinarius TaxID=2963433 RepID=UPI0020CD9E1C|nr:hypothetical protein [Natronobeatus ordinarius]
MGDKKFTFIELHLDGDTQFGPRSLPDLVTGIGESDEEHEELETDEEDVVAATDDSGANGAIAVVLGLAALVAIGVAVKKFRGGNDDEREEYDEPDVIVN